MGSKTATDCHLTQLTQVSWKEQGTVPGPKSRLFQLSELDSLSFPTFLLHPSTFYFTGDQFIHITTVANNYNIHHD